MYFRWLSGSRQPHSVEQTQGGLCLMAGGLLGLSPCLGGVEVARLRGLAGSSAVVRLAAKRLVDAVWGGLLAHSDSDDLGTTLPGGRVAAAEGLPSAGIIGDGGAYTAQGANGAGLNAIFSSFGTFTTVNRQNSRSRARRVCT